MRSADVRFEPLAGQEVAARGSRSDLREHERRDHSRDDPELHLGEAEDGIVGGNGDVGASGQSATAAEAVALDPGNDWSGTTVDGSEHPVQAERVLDVLLVAEVDRRALPVDVGAGAEALALTGQDHGPRVAHVGEGLCQLANELRVERVSSLGLVDRDAENRSISLDA